MLKQVYEIDNSGCLVKIKIAEFDDLGNSIETLAENLISTEIPNGLYKPIWNGIAWVSKMTEVEYIESLNNLPSESTKNELIMLAIADLDLKREADKLETQLAIAELAEILLGGTV